jgi:secreted trypsin-like serine protease
LLAIFVVGALAQENYDGPEYAPFDAAAIVPVEEMPGFWEGRDFPKASYTPNTRDRRIVGGTEVVPHSHPYQVALHISFGAGTGLCGGSVLTTRSVLTAAHCPINSASTLVIAGAHNRNVVEANQQRRTVPSANYRLHANYNPSNLNNDIAILITPTPAFAFGVAVQATRRPTVLTDLFVGSRVRATGWGRVTNTGATSAVLRKAYNTVITNAACAAVYGSAVVVASVICKETATSNQGTCNGDSGGVLAVFENVGGSGQPIQVGVTSFGASAGCVAGFPSGFARMTSFDAWINANQHP